MCLPAKLLCALVLLLALTSLFVHKSMFVLTFRKGQPNLSFCKFLVLLHNCYYRYCWILNFDIHSPLHFKNNSMRISKRSSFTIIIFIVSFSGSIDTIVFYKTGNHLPQCFWFSNSFFTVDGCIDCVEGILSSWVSVFMECLLFYFWICLIYQMKNVGKLYQNFIKEVF